MKLCSSWFCLAPLGVAVLISGVARGEDNNSIVTLHVTASDASASASPARLAYRLMGLAGARDPNAGALTEDPNTAAPADVSANPPGFFPDDVSNPHNVPAVLVTAHHPIYVNQPPSHWGNVGAFLIDLGRSEFVHVLDQYVGATADNRYTLGTQFRTSDFPVPANHTLGVSDILTLAHAAAAIRGAGHDHMYHVFLPEGVDMCIDAQTCYSPDNPATWVFCAFHGSATFSDLGDVLFSVEPFQNVLGCSVAPGSANGQLADSTDNVLSHEVFEALSDPDLSSWWVHAFTFANGEEIGDLCIHAARVGAHVYWSNPSILLNEHVYTVQPEYSNGMHGCSYSAP